MPFCEPETTTSSPQASVSIGTAPRLETASIASRHLRPRVRSPIAWMSVTVAVEVSECTTTASRSVSSAIASATTAGSGGRPHSHSSTVTSAPKARAIATQRSPNAPGRDAQHAIARLDQVGEDRLERAGARGREQQHVVLGAEDELELAQHLAVGRDEGGAAVVLLRLALDGEHLGRHRHGAGREQKGRVSHGRSPRAEDAGRAAAPRGRRSPS